MTWQLWIVVVLFLINAVSQPLTVGRADKPKEPAVAVGVAIVNLFFAGLVVWGAS